MENKNEIIIQKLSNVLEEEVKNLKWKIEYLEKNMGIGDC